MTHLFQLIRNYREQRLRERCVRYAAMSKRVDVNYIGLINYYYEFIKGSLSWVKEPEEKK